MENLKISNQATLINIASENLGKSASLSITGLPYELHNSPEKIAALLDLLEMPKKANVNISYHISSVIER